MAEEAINNMLSAGILFREYAPEPEEGDTCNAVAMSPMPLGDDPYFKLKCLELAVASQGTANRKDLILGKAREFEAYLKGEQ